MSFLDAEGSRAYAAQAASASTVVATFSGAVPIGRVLVVRVSNRAEDEPGDATTGETDYHQTLVDSKGNAYTKAAEVSRASAVGEPGVTLSAWTCEVAVALEIGDTLTAGFDISRRGRMLAAHEFSAEEDGSTITVVDVATATGRGGTVQVTLTPPAGDEFTWVGAGATSKRDVGGVTPDPSYTSDLPPAILDNGFDDSATLWGQYRPLFDVAETWDATIADASHRWALILLAITVTPPDSGPPTPGTREFQADFETPTHATLETSTSLRPDALTRSMRLASCDGPIAIGDASAGIEARRWQVRTTDGFSVEARRSDSGNAAWEAWTPLFTVPGTEPITELDVAFAVDGKIVVAMERPNGAAGAPRVNLYRWDYSIGIDDYDFKGVADGRSPRIINDEFPFISAVPYICPPEVDVQLFYMKPGVGMARRQESDDWDVDYPTVVAYHSQRRIEEAVKTVDRRISVLLSRRTVSTGRYALERVDSVPYADALLRRPTFESWSSPANDLVQSGEQAWYSPPSQTTADWYCRISTPQDVDAIEIQASGSYPAGIEPSFPLDNQEHVASLNAGDAHDFVFSVTHGGGTMSHVAFRARTRRLVSGTLCYSPWRYMVIPAAFVSSPVVTDTPVNCGRDLLIELANRLQWTRDGLVEGIRESFANNPCDSETVYSISDQNGGQYWFIGGQLNTGPSFPFPTHFQRWAVRRRPWEDLSFVDEDGVVHQGRVLGAVTTQWAGSAVTKAFDWSGDRLPRQFPDDTGRFPDYGESLDVIAST